MDVRQLLQRLQGLRNRALLETHGVFWADYLNVVVPLCLARGGHLAIFHDQHWQWMEVSPKDSLNHPTQHLSQGQMQSLPDTLQVVFNRALANGFALLKPGAGATGQDLSYIYLAVRLEGPLPRILLLELDFAVEERLNEILLRAQLVADIAAGQNSATNSPGLVRDEVVELLAVLVEVFQTPHWRGATYALANGLVSHSSSIDQVAVAYAKGEYMQLHTLSHFDRFEKKTDTAKLFEAALEEAADQSQMIHWLSQTHRGNMITLAHEQLKLHLGCVDLVTLPVESAHHGIFAAVMLVSYSQPIPQETQQATQFLLNLASERLYEVYSSSFGPLRRLGRGIYTALAWFFGKDWLLSKVATLIIVSLVIWGVFGSLPFRIQATAELTTDATQLISAPQDGYIQNVMVTAGDAVKAGDLLVQMETQDLLLQQSELSADLFRYGAEESKARAAFKLVDAEIAKAKIAQVKVRLERTQLMLQAAKMLAPFNAIVVEGERKDLLGAPVKKGQTLFRLARIEGMYLKILVEEMDVHWVKIGDRGEFAFVSQPLEPLAFRVTGILPVAKVSGQQGATFVVTAQFDSPAQTWWRSGMTGVAKIDQGDAAPFWVLGRKLYQRLRLWLWW